MSLGFLENNNFYKTVNGLKRSILNNFKRKRAIETFPHTNLKMEDITKVWGGPLPSDSPYLKPLRFHFIQNSKEKTKDIVKTLDSVVIILFNKTRQKLVFVRQFRPAVYYSIVKADGVSIDNIDLKKYSPSLGITLELCGGAVDKKKSLREIAREEIFEECGYEVDVNKVEEILTFRSAIGSQGSLRKMYYCEVTDADKKSKGGGVDDELIEVIEYSIDECKKFVQTGAVNSSPACFLLGIMWFLMNKAKN